MMKWEKTAKKHYKEVDIIVYETKSNPHISIESRKERIPHAARPGYWLLTSYYLIKPDGSEKRFSKLSEAKAAAEMYI